MLEIIYFCQMNTLKCLDRVRSTLEKIKARKHYSYVHSTVEKNYNFVRLKPENAEII